MWRRTRIVGRDETRLAEEAVETHRLGRNGQWGQAKQRSRVGGSQSVSRISDSFDGRIKVWEESLGEIVDIRVRLVPCTCGRCCLVRSTGILYLPDFSDLSSRSCQNRFNTTGFRNGCADDSVLATRACP
jgi:hypothetical protein